MIPQPYNYNDFRFILFITKDLSLFTKLKFDSFVQENILIHAFLRTVKRR